MNLPRIGLILIMLAPSVISSQNKLTVGVYTGYAYTFHASCSLSDKSIHRGTGGTIGTRLGYDLGNRFRTQIIAKYNGLGASDYFDQTIEFQFLVRFYLFKPDKIGALRPFVETGVGKAINGRLQLPTLFGAEYNFNDRFSLNIATQLPVLYMANTSIGNFNFVTYAAEIGFVYRFGKRPIREGFQHNYSSLKLKNSTSSSKNPRFL